jgi:hypothetical protein
MPSRDASFSEPAGLNDFDDPSEWAKASYEHHPCDDFEPLPDVPNPYRRAALHHLGLMYSVDQFLTEAKDARFAVIVVAIVLGWPSTPGLYRHRNCRPIGMFAVER